MTKIIGDSYRELLIRSLEVLLSQGKRISPRGQGTIELQDVCLSLTNPRDRVALLKGRKANIFATLAETLWVLAGRNDVGFISTYLRRISEFSDDGQRLRGGYGPRIRSWYEVDQLKRTFELLSVDPSTRRAVIMLFDPLRDGDNDLKDIPCNNWLQFLIRDQKLHVKVVSRSMDVIWGSTINIFEWTALQELMAHWLNVDLGHYHHYIGSFHIYDDFVDRARDVLSEEQDYRSLPSVAWDVNFDELDAKLNALLMWIEDYRGQHVCPPEELIDDQGIIGASAWLLLAYRQHQMKRYDDAAQSIMQIPDSDLRRMGVNFFLRTRKYGELLNLGG